MGLTGEVLVSLRGAPTLPVPEILLGKGSGHDALDLRAVEMLRTAAKFAPLPASLAGVRFQIVIPIQFLGDE